MATNRLPKCNVTDFGFAPVTRSRSVTFVPVGTAPNGDRYAVLNVSWRALALPRQPRAKGTCLRARGEQRATPCGQPYKGQIFGSDPFTRATLPTRDSFCRR